MSRRARLSPEAVGLQRPAGKRRVPGLRREEVALLARMSVSYYIRLERGNLPGVSESVLRSIARALRLDQAETVHLFDLARAVSGTPPMRRETSPQTVRRGIHQLIDAMTSMPAWVRNQRSEILAANTLARVLFEALLEDGSTPPNSARFTFLNPKARQFYTDWACVADDSVAMLRAAAGRNPYDETLTKLIGELRVQSEEFRTRWARYDIKFQRAGRKRLSHPVVGCLDLVGEALELPEDPGLHIDVYRAEPGSMSADSLERLARLGDSLSRRR